MYFQPDPIRVVLVFEGETLGSIQEQVAEFPMMKAGLFEVDVIRLGPWLPFGVLLGPQATGPST